MIKIVDSIALLESQAEDFENKAKIELRKKNYAEAILFFEEAVDIYLKLNWDGKIKMLEKTIERLQNVIGFENNNHLNSNFINIKQEIENKSNNLTKTKEVPEEIKQKLAKIEMLERKADNDEIQGNLKRSFDRYQLILELTTDINSLEQFNFENKIVGIKEKINKLTERLKSNL